MFEVGFFKRIRSHRTGFESSLISFFAFMGAEFVCDLISTYLVGPAYAWTSKTNHTEQRS